MVMKVVKKISNNRGESLAEVLVSALVIALAFVMVFTMVTMSANMLKRTDERFDEYYTIRNALESRKEVSGKVTKSDIYVTVSGKIGDYTLYENKSRTCYTAEVDDTELKVYGD